MSACMPDMPVKQSSNQAGLTYAVQPAALHTLAMASGYLVSGQWSKQGMSVMLWLAKLSLQLCVWKLTLIITIAGLCGTVFG